MKNKFFLALSMSFCSCIMYSQTSDSSIKVADVFTIGKVHNNNFKCINFPKPNFIIKKGGIVNYKNIIGKKVEITSIKKKKDGSLVATIRLASKRSFFNSHKYITVDINEAVNTKELLRI